jgi:hypothetical protein
MEILHEAPVHTTGARPVYTLHPNPRAALKKRHRPKGGQLSLRDLSKELAARGFLNELGKPYAAKSVASMLR